MRKNEKVENLRAISKSISEYPDIIKKGAQALTFESLGRLIEKAFKFGAFNGPEYMTLRNEVETFLSQKEKEIHPYISAWSAFIRQLKRHKSLPLPTEGEIEKDFSADRELAAKSISEEAEAIEQTDLASTKQNTPLAKHWKITAWLKEFYGLTIERFFKAFFDKYG